MHSFPYSAPGTWRKWHHQVKHIVHIHPCKLSCVSKVAQLYCAELPYSHTWLQARWNQSSASNLQVLQQSACRWSWSLFSLQLEIVYHFFSARGSWWIQLLFPCNTFWKLANVIKYSIWLGKNCSRVHSFNCLEWINHLRLSTFRNRKNSFFMCPAANSRHHFISKQTTFPRHCEGRSFHPFARIGMTIQIPHEVWNWIDIWKATESMRFCPKVCTVRSRL